MADYKLSQLCEVCKNSHDCESYENWCGVNCIPCAGCRKNVSAPRGHRVLYEGYARPWDCTCLETVSEARLKKCFTNAMIDGRVFDVLLGFQECRQIEEFLDHALRRNYVDLEYFKEQNGLLLRWCSEDRLVKMVEALQSRIDRLAVKGW